VAVDILPHLAVVSLGQVKSRLGNTFQSGKDDVDLQRLIHAVVATANKMGNRDSFISTQYVHDGTALDRLNGTGMDFITLPNTPVTAVSVLKRTPDETALVQGWNEQFDFDPWTGEVRILSGAVFEDQPRTVEITYTGGYVGASASAADRARYGLEEKASDLVRAVLDQIEVFWQQKGKLVLQGMTITGGSYTFAPQLLLPHVHDCFVYHRHRAV
jgi:hypothetical protein